MKKYSILLFVFGFFALVGCKPNLVVQNAAIDFNTKTVGIKVKNTGNKDAAEQLTYIEINAVGISNDAKPQSQFIAHVPIIIAGSTWSSGTIPLSSFSSPRGLDLLTLTTANLVVRADAKNMVDESNENDNLFDANQ